MSDSDQKRQSRHTLHLIHSSLDYYNVSSVLLIQSKLSKKFNAGQKKVPRGNRGR